MKQSERILIVDDNPRNILILKKLLSSHCLRMAGTGEEALVAAVEFQPDLILLDIMMPGIDGYETCRRLRAMRDLTHSPKIIMVSAKAIVTERLQGYEAGADDYVTKPFNPEELQAKVDVYLRLKSMEEMDRLRDSLITLLSHETRTPITCLLAAVELMRERPGRSPEDLEMLALIENSSRRLHHLVDRVVTLSMLRAGSLGLERVSTCLRSMLGVVVGQATPAATARGVTLEYRPEAAPQVLLDSRFSELVIKELLQNAVAKCAENGHVRVELGHDAASAQAVVTFTDDGCGIDPVVLRHVFREFVVGDLSHHHSGTGLGLPIAHLFVQEHGGTMEVRSTPGEGTVVTLRLPAEAAQGDGTPEPDLRLVA